MNSCHLVCFTILFLYFQTYGPSSTAENIISQLQKEKENYFSNRYLELGKA